MLSIQWQDSVPLNKVLVSFILCLISGIIQSGASNAFYREPPRAPLWEAPWPWPPDRGALRPTPAPTAHSVVQPLGCTTRQKKCKSHPGTWGSLRVSNPDPWALFFNKNAIVNKNAIANIGACFRFL